MRRDLDEPGPPSAAALEEKLRLTAYFLWEQDGRPEGRQDEYWQRARMKLVRERTCDRWLREQVRDGTDDPAPDL